MVNLFDKTTDESVRTLTLTPDDLDLLVRFFRRALRLHETGVISSESVLEYLKLVTDAIDPQHAGSMDDIRSALEDAWREADG
jgi:hypothetical protein